MQNNVRLKQVNWPTELELFQTRHDPHKKGKSEIIMTTRTW